MGVNHSRLEVTPALPAKEQVVDGVCYVLIEAFFHLRSTEMLNLHFHYSQWKDNCQGGCHSSKKLMTNRLTLTDKQTAWVLTPSCTCSELLKLNYCWSWESEMKGSNGLWWRCANTPTLIYVTKPPFIFKRRLWLEVHPFLHPASISSAWLSLHVWILEHLLDTCLSVIS